LGVLDAEVLFAEHKARVFRYLCRMVGRADTAHDLTQDVFLRVVRAGEPNVESRKAWLFKIARNTALNHVRDSRRQPMPADLVDRAEPATQELGVAVREAVAALQELDRDVFLMREIAGLSYGEIASACELTVEAVRSRLHRARQQLREALDGPIRAQRRRGVIFGGDRNVGDS